MFNIENYPSILFHFKNLSRIFKKNNSGWYELFCPYCDDAVRKANPNHGHFNLAPDYPFVHCFRCGYRSSLIKALIDTGFNDVAVINEIQKYGNIVYSAKKSNFKSLKSDNELENKLITHCEKFMKYNVQDFLTFKNYINFRCDEIDPVYFGLIPNYIYKELVVQMINSNGNIVTNRFIFPKDKRYHIPSERHLYYFQPIGDIIDYSSIVFCEGGFDLINLYTKSPLFKNSFFIAIGGSNYRQSVVNIISNFLLIGRYDIHIVYDKNVDNIEFISNSILNQGMILNPNISFSFYQPALDKDVSDCNYLDQIS